MIKILKKLLKNSAFILSFFFGSKAEATDTLESDSDIGVYAEHVLSEEEKINLTKDTRKFSK